MSFLTLTAPQIAALKDAHQSINEGGLTEARCRNSMGTEWLGNSSDSNTAHTNAAVHFLFTEGLLERLGVSPNREAFITEIGIFELKAAGELT